VPVVVIEVLLGVLTGPDVLRLTEFESFMSVCTPRATRHTPCNFPRGGPLRREEWPGAIENGQLRAPKWRAQM